MINFSVTQLHHDNPFYEEHYPQWNQILETLIYFVFVNIGALLLRVNLTFKISKEIKMSPWMV